jgi:hemolysin activation/secretion protein
LVSIQILKLKFFQKNSFTVFIFLTLSVVFFIDNAHAGLGAGPAVHDRNIIPLAKPQIRLSDNKALRNLNPVSGIFRIDDSGSRSTGFIKSTLGVNFNQPFKKGETISIRQIHTNGGGSDYFEIGTRFPLEKDGSILAFRAGAIEYDAGQQNASLDPTGNSDFIEANLITPIFKSNDLNLNIGLSAIRSSYIEKRASILKVDKIDNRADLSIYFDFYDQIFNQSGTIGKFVFSHGYMDLSNNVDDVEQRIAGAGGSFSKVIAQFNRLEKITEKNNLYIRFKSQYALDNLESAEEFSLGGLYNVRVYPNSEGGGADNADSGYVINFELEHNVNKNVKVFAFYDFGKIQIYKDTPAGSLTGTGSFKTYKNEYNLKDTGLGAEWEILQGTKINMLWAHKLGINHGRRNDGTNFDRTNMNDMLRFGFTQQF